VIKPVILYACEIWPIVIEDEKKEEYLGEYQKRTISLKNIK